AIFSNKLATSSLSWAGDRTSRSSGGLTQSLNRTPPRRTKRIMHPCPGFCPYYAWLIGRARCFRQAVQPDSGRGGSTRMSRSTDAVRVNDREPIQSSPRVQNEGSHEGEGGNGGAARPVLQQRPKQRRLYRRLPDRCGLHWRERPRRDR